MLRFPYGIETKTGRIVTPDQVERGAACGCVCTGCGGALIAAQGEVNRWHFRHAVTDADSHCHYSPESDAHRWAKQEIVDAGWVTVPRLQAYCRGRVRQVSEPRQVRFTIARPEQWMGDIARRPDVLAETEDGLLAIEIFVAHRCGPEKIADFGRFGLASIEINLSGWRERTPSNVVLTDATRAWLFHPGKAEADARFAVDEAERERLIAERAAELQRRRDEWAAARAAEKEAERAAREAVEAEERARWEVIVAEQREVKRRLEAEAAIVREAQRQAREIQNAIARQEAAELQIAAARSAVLVYEMHWGDIPDGQAVLARARENLIATERRYAAPN